MARPGSVGLLSLLLLLPLLATTGCVNRTILRAQDTPDESALLLETLDVYPGVSRVHRFWICRNDPTQLTCFPECGGETGLACRQVSAAGASNLR